MVHKFLNYLNTLADNIENALDILTKKYPNISYKVYDNLVIFKYNASYGSEIERSCRGLIIDKNTGKIVCHSNEGTIDLESFIEKVDLGKCVIEENLEGTLINLYHYRSRWNVSTKFCINAENSKFRGEKSFRQYFDKVCKIDYDALDKNFTYSFLLQVPENRLVTKMEKRKLYHIESQNNITGEKVYCDIGIPKPVVLKLNNINILKINSYRAINKALSKLDWSKRGFMLYSLDRNFRCSLINPAYKAVYDLIKNQSDLRYLLLESFYYNNNLNDILYYFPEYKKIKDTVVDDVEKLINKIYDKYLDVYCYKNTDLDTVNGKYKKLLGEIHKLYKINHRNNLLFRIDSDNVKDVILKQNCPYVYTVLYK